MPFEKGNKLPVTHGLSYTCEYNSYLHARYRCCNPKCDGYENYGGRGIQFRFKSFEEFIEHIGLKPSPELTLDRINNEGHYEIGNVRWATRAEQTHNSRPKRRKNENANVDSV